MNKLLSFNLHLTSAYTTHGPTVNFLRSNNAAISEFPNTNLSNSTKPAKKSLKKAKISKKKLPKKPETN